MPLSSFATIIGLLSNFLSEKRAISDDEYKEFILWLEKKRHKQLIEEIGENHLLSLGIKNLLKEGHNVVISKLENLDIQLSIISSQIEGLNEISSAISPNLAISDQAMLFLKQIDATKASGVEEQEETFGTDGPTFELLDGDFEGDNLNIIDQRFIEDDFITLVSLNFLHEKLNNNKRIFFITRSGVNFLHNSTN